MHSLANRLAKLEASTHRGQSAVTPIEETDDDDRVTGYRFGGYYPGNYFFPRDDGEALEAFRARAEAHAQEGRDGEVMLLVTCFVPAANGRPAWKNGVGPV